MNGIVYSIDSIVRFKDSIGRRRTGRIDRFVHTLGSSTVTDKDYLVYGIVALDNIEGYKYKKYEVQGKDILGYVTKTTEEMIKASIEENYCGGFTYLPDMVKKPSFTPLKQYDLNYEKIIFNGPATIVIWKDGSKTISKCSENDIFDPEKGVAICFMKRALGETEGKKVLRNTIKDYYDGITREVNKSFDEELRKLTFPLPKGITFRPFNFCVSMDSNKVVNIDQSTIDEVKKVEEDNNLAVGSCYSTCEYCDRPMTKDPCCHCLSGDQYKKRKEDNNVD